jgi:DNA ligase (NAD+)
MTKQEAKQRIEKLKELINKYRYSRLVLDKVLIEESVEDSLKKELFDLEQDFPELVTPDSPTQRVGGKPLKKFEKFVHSTRMLSFNDAFGCQDMEDWQERLKRVEPKAVEAGFYTELKIDGLSIELIYEEGVFKLGATRGDGTTGENVTENLKTVEAVPLRINWDKKMPKTIIVRGEVFLSKKEFNQVNKEREKAGLPIYANPRNLAAGSIRQLDPKITAARKLDSFAYSLITDMGQKVHEDEHKILHELGFKTNPNNKFSNNLEEVQELRDYWEKHRDGLGYEIDGLVVILSDNKMFSRLGVVGKAPRGAIAYKFSPRESTTKVKDIIVSVGRTGVLTPVAVLEPVEIGGTTVSRATLHNEDEIKRLGVRIGDTVVVSRAGDVIPDIMKVLTELRTGKEKIFHFPAKCPVCNQPVRRVEGEAAYKCTNKNCPAIKREGIYHFVSRGAMDIEGVGPQTIDQLMDVGIIKDAADLYFLKKEDLLNLERFADKSAENFVDAMWAKKKAPFDRFLFALGIPHVGSEKALDLARKFGSLQKLEKASLEDLNGMRDFGKVVSKSVYDWFRSDYGQKLLKKFENAGVEIVKEKLVEKSAKLKGLSFIFTGSLETMSRERAQELVRENGGDVVGAVSKQTDYVVAGTEPGSKYEKAQKLGVKIISEKEFVNMLK